MQDKNNILIDKLDEFIRKYYKNQLLKGVIYSSGIVLASFLSVVLLEYFGEFNITLRTILFFAFLSATLGVIGNYIILPLLKLNRIGKIISYDQAANIIGNHFSNVQDKLLNVLQLQNNKAMNGSDELLVASINQKITELKPVPFVSAIDLSDNKKYLRYTLPVLFLFTCIYLIWPQIIHKSTTRLLHYQTYYEKEMPFKFEITDKNLKAIQAQDYNLEVKITGEQVPNEVSININGIEYRLEKENNITFKYTFKNPQSNTDFQLSAAGFNSKEYTLEVLPKPSLMQFNLQLVYPAYLGKPNENLSNSGDLQVPAGTRVSWVFNTRNTDNLKLRFMDTLALPVRSTENQFSFSRRFLHSNSYTIKASNQFILNAPDSVNYSINVIPDQYPTIDVSEKTDSINPKNLYFSGQIKDDYGFNHLTFFYKKFGSDSTGKTAETAGSFPISINRTQVSQPYFYFLDAARFDLQPGDKVEYFFEVYDNDGVNGSKSAKTQLMTFKAPTKDEINENTSKNNSEIKKDLEESIKKAKQLQKDVNELSKKINDKKQLGYDEKKKLEDLLKKQNELKNKIEEIKQENQMNNQQQNEFSQTDENLMEKQKQLEQLFENVMTPEMKKLFDELNKMLDKLDKNEVQQKLDEMKLSNKDLEKELDRNLEAFKQLEVQQKMQQAIDKLDELKKKEDDLNKETEAKKDDKDNKNSDNKNQDKKDDKNKDNKNQDKKSQDEKTKELEKKQEDIKKEFDKLKEELKDVEKKNSELEEPNALPKTEEKQNEISKEMQNSSEQLNKDNKKNASKSQKSASQKMEEMKEQMEKAMESQEQQQDEENAATLRQILENLLNLSFAQEELVKQLPKTRVDNPQYVKIPQEQNKLKDDCKIIEDSLLALSKRVPKISALVNREINAINMNMEKTVKSLADRNTGDATMRMQSTMTSVNNLALLLNESLEQMKEQMKQQQKNSKPGNGKCKKPGSGSGQKPSPTPAIPNMRKLQEQLNQQLQQLKDAMEKGQKPGDKPGDKKGQKPGGGMGQNGNGSSMMPGSSEQMAKLAAQQEALRRQMQSLMDKMKNKGKNPGGDIADMMEQTEKDIVNKQISNETMKRQQDILSKLLESEKAEREREQDEQRKSNEAKNENLSNPGQFLEYKRLREKELELLNTVPPSLTPYYKEKVNNYFNSVNK
ncbi:MAG: DUF4175 domain-containing protein [Bacteroidetes bacterium]|nr:DUF4175 domain-containing protein [Bacteroidota bacterium]